MGLAVARAVANLPRTDLVVASIGFIDFLLVFGQDTPSINLLGCSHQALITTDQYQPSTWTEWAFDTQGYVD